MSVFIISIACSFVVYSVYAAPKAPGFGSSDAQCWTRADPPPNHYTTTCCWNETDAEGIELRYCQHCDYDPATKTHSGCGEAHTVEYERSTVPSGNLDDLPTLETVPSEESSQDESPTNNQNSNGANLPLTQNRENLPLNNEFTELQEQEQEQERVDNTPNTDDLSR